MKIKKGDNVLIIAGKDSGKSGLIAKVFSAEKVIVENVNVCKKHSGGKGVKGAIIEKPMPIHASNVQLVCPKCGKAARIGKRIIESGKKVRICKKCNEEI